MNARAECVGDLDRTAPAGYATAMVNDDAARPSADAPTRAERLAAALRANLHRRKAQARARGPEQQALAPAAPAQTGAPSSASADDPSEP